MINSLLSLGRQSLMNAQVGISVTGENIANIDTEGYSRRTVTYSTNSSISVNGLSLGNGASVEQIKRNYDTLLESQYLTANSESTYWSTLAENLYNVESLFTESDDYGVSTALDTFLDSFTSLGSAPDDAATRQELLSYAQTLIDSLSILDSSLDDTLATLETEIAAGVDEVNSLIEQIATLNNDITSNPDDLNLQDQRSAAIRELSELLDVTVIEGENSRVSVLTSGGLPLVDGVVGYQLTLEGAQVQKDLTTDSEYDGELYYSGESNEEFYVEFTSSGPTDGTASAATFRVSLDGGKTWVSDDDGVPLEFTAGGYEDRVEVAGLEIWFGQSEDSSSVAASDAAKGDSFTVMPKTGVYWNSTTGGKVNVTPLTGGDGARLQEGELAALLATRDQYAAEYAQELEVLADAIIWQVNYQHSQGAGLEHYSYEYGSTKVEDTGAALGESHIPYAGKLQSGGVSFAFYDADTGESLGVETLDFSSVTPGTSNFDPGQHSLEDVAAAINASFSGQLQADIVDGRLQLTAADGVTFEFAGDSSGLMAALGLNTFFTGSDISDMAVDQDLAADTDRINAAMVNASGAVASGDNTNALALGELAEKEVSLDSLYVNSSQTLSEHLHAIISQVGADTDTAARNYTQASALAEDLDERQQEVAGVSLDEELTNLTRYQQAYQAASKLIQTANEMFEVVMALKS